MQEGPPQSGGTSCIYYSFDKPSFLYSSTCSSCGYFHTEYSTNTPKTTLTTSIVITVPVSNTTPFPSPNRSAVSKSKPQKLYNPCTNAQQKMFFVFFACVCIFNSTIFVIFAKNREREWDEIIGWITAVINGFFSWLNQGD